MPSTPAVSFSSLIAPRRADLKSAALALVRKAKNEGTLGPQTLKAPVRSPDRYPHFEVPQRPGTADLAETAYVIKGKVYLQQIGFSGIPMWQTVGKLQF